MKFNSGKNPEFELIEFLKRNFQLNGNLLFFLSVQVGKRQTKQAHRIIKRAKFPQFIRRIEELFFVSEIFFLRFAARVHREIFVFNF